MSGRTRSQPTAVIPTPETKEAFLKALGEARKLSIQAGREVRFGCPLHRALDTLKGDVDQLAFPHGPERVLPGAAAFGTTRLRDGSRTSDSASIRIGFLQKLQGGAGRSLFTLRLCRWLFNEPKVRQLARLTIGVVLCLADQVRAAV